MGEIHLVLVLLTEQFLIAGHSHHNSMKDKCGLGNVLEWGMAWV